MRKGKFFESNNPLIAEKALKKRRNNGPVFEQAETMSVTGAVNKTITLTLLLMITALFSFAYPSPLLMWGGAIGGLIAVIVSVMKPHLSPTVAPIYALLEGLFVGSISAFYGAAFNGIVFQAITLTLALLFIMLMIYKSGLIKVTDKFRTGVVMATGAIFVVYLINFVLGFFGISMPYLHESGMMGIGISIAIIGVACLNFLLDFDNFDKGEEMGLPRYYEWFFGMGLLITLVWLYVEMLSLLARLNSD